MKAKIKDLWNTDREIITFDVSEFECPSSFRELEKCDNVIVGEKIDEDRRCKTRYVQIDDISMRLLRRRLTILPVMVS